MLAVWVGTYIEKSLRIDDAVGAVAVHGVCGFYGVFLVGIFAGGYPTGINNIPVSFGGQLMGMMAFLPLAFLPGYAVSWILKKMNLLRVPAEVELEGLDLAEFGQDFYPEFERVPEIIIEPDGREVDARRRPARGVQADQRQGDHEGRERKEVAMFDSFPYDEWSEDVTDFWTFGGANSTGTYIMTVLGCILMVASISGGSSWRTASSSVRRRALRRHPARSTAFDPDGDAGD